MNDLYPLKFIPIYKEKIWGGQKINTILNKDFSPMINCGESWEISGLEDNVSVVSNGFLKGNSLNELIEVYMGDLVGDKVYEKFGNEFPLLIKFIDANDFLSVQVHPDDKLALKRHNSYGKTEMWYVVQADKNAQIICGFKGKIDKEAYQKNLDNHTLKKILNYEDVRAGDVFYVPAGRIHAIGPGILLAEIQQSSDITYRVYDWDRIDDKGKYRELHTPLALESIDFNHCSNYKTEYERKINQTISLANCPYFSTNIIELDKKVEKEFYHIDSFIIYMCIEGDIQLSFQNNRIDLYRGETIMIPAEIKNFSFKPLNKAKLLEVFIT